MGAEIAVAAAARQKGVPVTRQFREFLAWELRRSLGLYSRAIALPAFAWNDRQLERLWRKGDPFVVKELRALYAGKGVTPGKDVIAYCRIGERSSHTWFVLHELLGYPNVRNYDGSWTEWGNSVRVPVEKS